MDSLEAGGGNIDDIEAKLAQQLAYLEQAPLYRIFVDLRKAYAAMDRDGCLMILKGYGVGPNMPRLIKYFWDEAVLVCRATGYYECPLKAHRGATQGGPVSPSISNVMVDVTVCLGLGRVLGQKGTRLGYGEAV